jgi:hypothetical protein
MKTELIDGRIEVTKVDGNTITKTYFTKRESGEYYRGDTDEQLDLKGVEWLTDEQKADHTATKEQEQINADSLAYLASTDWYVVRQQETGTDIPQEVLDKRAEARAAVVRA